MSKEHRCDGMPESWWRIEGDELFYEDESYPAFTAVKITHCPWCGVKVDESE